MTERIVSHVATQEYRDNFDRIFGKTTHQDAHSEQRRGDQNTGEQSQGKNR